MALHRYVVDIEYNDNPGYHPITVTVNHYKEEPAVGEYIGEYSGKRLNPLLAKAVAKIAQEEAGEVSPEV